MVMHDKENKKNSKETDPIQTDEKSQENKATDNTAPAEQGDQEQPEQEPEIIDEKEIMIKTLQDKNEELNDKYLRLFSEFDNFRKRSMKEKLELTKTASADIIEAVLPVVDDLERAYKSALENPDIEALVQGLNLIQTKIKTTLKHKGLEEIPAQGEVFDTDYHEAITHAPAQDEKDKGKVIEEIQKGYTLNGKVLRFAKVIVAN
jgi:molecular chaperone GrpE